MWLPIFLFGLGACVGSFLNVCIWRLPRHESVVQPPSHCPKCDTQLQPLDLVPLLSQLALRSRCRYCGTKISWRYFGIELLTGLLFALIGVQPGYISDGQWVGDPVMLARGLVFMATLVVIFWVDYDVRLIQLESVLILGLCGIGAEIWRNYQAARLGFGPETLTRGELLTPWGVSTLLPAPLPQSLLALIVAASFLWVMRELFSRLYGREAMGFGDVLLVGAIAANLGWNVTLVWFFFLSFTIGALLGVMFRTPAAIHAYYWAKRRQKLYGTEGALKKLPCSLVRHSYRRGIPFGPMLAIGAVLALLYGNNVNQAYMTLWQ